MKPFYVTTSIAYPNANPHIGFALELVQADFLARYHRLTGRDVYFLTGVDVHGLKIFRTAEKQGMTAEAFVDEKSLVFNKLLEDLHITADRFIKTNDADHELTAQALWRMCAKRGDIYKRQYQAWYNVKEEEFLGLVEEYPDPKVFGVDPQFIEKIDEENYFFALSKYSDEIIRVLTEKLYKVVPENRLQEQLNFAKQKGLQDVSISREKTKLPWGIPVPEDENQVMYVWYDALANYLTPVSTVDANGDLNLDERWPPSVHCIGKDIGRFHALLWTGMMMSAGIDISKEVLIHGFITSEGQKMSKSIGNVVDPFDVIAEHGADAVRWFLLKEVPTTGDADYTAERMQQVYNADLANDLGNLVSRVWTMCQKYCEGNIPAGQDDSVITKTLQDSWKNYEDAVDRREFDTALKTAHELLVYCNKRIDQEKPWVLAKDPNKTADLHTLLYKLLEVLRHVTLMMSPAIPDTAEKIAAQVFPFVSKEAWNSIEIGSVWGVLQPGDALGAEQTILFPKKAA